MSRLIGVAQSSSEGESRRVFAAMQASLDDQAPLSVVCDEQDRWLFGCSGVAIQHQPQRAHAGLRVAVLGIPDSPTSGGAVGAASATAAVAAAYQRHGRQLGRGLTGAYAAVLIDPQAELVLLVNDVLGTFPIYWLKEGRRVAWGTSLRSVVQASSSTPSLDPRAAADYLHYGLLFGTRTLASNVSMVPAGATLVYSWRDGQIEVLQHASPASLFTKVDQDHTTYLERVRESFNDSVARASRGADGLGLSLSGGLDSRAILSAVPGSAGPVRTYTVGVKLCADDVIATKLSKLRGTEHLFLELGDQYLRDFLPNLERMVRLTDGMYPEPRAH